MPSPSHSSAQRHSAVRLLTRAARGTAPKIIPSLAFLSGLLLALLSLQSCETLAPEERWQSSTAIQPQKYVLLEEYTGQRCPNCPAAAATLHHLQTTGASGAYLIGVAIHGGGLSLSANKYPDGLATDDSQYYHEQHQVKAWPRGRIDGGPLASPDTWAAQVAERVQATPRAQLLTTLHYEASTRQLQVSHVANAPSNTRLTAYLVEDSLSAMQYFPDNVHQSAYLHRHVLRQVLTPRDGLALTTAHEVQQPQLPLSRDSHVLAQFAHEGYRTQLFAQQLSLILPTVYGNPAVQRLVVRPQQLSVVSFLTDATTGRVLQTTLVRLPDGTHHTTASASTLPPEPASTH